ncbi:MAG: hypothetical protein COB76_00960 [Alphaproteobacteria bacterium]|nr:MAG: hypothetical protein COB76_00960 [Alphaproteobacteria bacterium]
MINEGRKTGLVFNTRTVNDIVLGKNKKKKYTPLNPLALPNDSMSWGWRIIEYLPRKESKQNKTKRTSFAGVYFPSCEPRFIPDGAIIHKSVFERRDTAHDFEQLNLPLNHKKL